ncbi:15914_t:CDS:2 [Cetraspora pellucida]|uniref:15914_t:CDS:1 n=1 Tax=Cetraspora pellucida TaxID=1433469 RepID=A0A9N9EY11_9GLOM|nr:15914_t:CDS:2 [Cetraspora pellucida]
MTCRDPSQITPSVLIMKSLIKNQPDLNDILIALNQLQLDSQTLHQENADLKNTLNQLHALGEMNGQYREPKLQPNHYPNNQTQVGLLGSLLMGSALAWFASLLEKQSELLDDFDMLVKELKAMFGDADKARTATNKIRKLIQRSRLASSYASEFRQISGDLDWKEATLIDQFRTGLRNNIKDLLLILEDPILLNDAISKAVHCDN